ncbi:Signal recognition particle subunit SRP72, partial [Eumeta japonica]
PEFCRQCCLKLTREFNSEARAALVGASSLLREGKPDAAVELLLKHGGHLQLAAVQILLAQGDRKAAIKLLEDSVYKYRPGVIGLLCTLLCADNEYERASQLFKDVYDHYKNDQASLSSLRNLWRAAAEVHARVGDAAAAARAYEALASAAPHDTHSLARLVKALAKAEPTRARQLAAGLPPLEQLESKIDIEALESSKWMMGAKVVKKTAQSKQEQSPGTPGSELLQKKKQQKKRKRKTKLPPNADLSRPPDPERLIELRRSFVRGSSTPSFLRVQVRDGGLIFCLKPGRLLVGDTTPTVLVVVPLRGVRDMCPVQFDQSGTRVWEEVFVSILSRVRPLGDPLASVRCSEEFIGPGQRCQTSGGRCAG